MLDACYSYTVGGSGLPDIHEWLSLCKAFPRRYNPGMSNIINFYSITAIYSALAATLFAVLCVLYTMVYTQRYFLF